MTEISKKIYVIIVLLAATVFLNSCFGEDTPVAPYQPDGTTLRQVDIGRLYNDQIYFSLLLDSLVLTTNVEDYDFAFDCFPNEWGVSTNPSGLYRVADLGVLPIDYNLNIEGRTPLRTNGDSLDFKNELYTGYDKDLAIGEWYQSIGQPPVSLNHLYISELGLDSRARVKGYVRFIIDSVDTGTYYCTFANIEGDSIWTEEIPKRPFKNHVFYKVGEGVKDIEPISDNWDLHFTRFNDATPDQNLDSFNYSVVGVLINDRRIQAQDVRGASFEDFALEDALQVQYTDTTHVIGYDWKSFDLDADNYYYPDSLFYSVKTAEGIYFKLRFVSFTTEEGVRGAPMFEYIKL